MSNHDIPAHRAIHVDRSQAFRLSTVAMLIALTLLIYVASFGPACWISNRVGIGERAFSIGYQPMLWLWMRTEHPAKVVAWYALLGARDASHSINTVEGMYELNW